MASKTVARSGSPNEQVKGRFARRFPVGADAPQTRRGAAPPRPRVATIRWWPAPGLPADGQCARRG